MRLNDRSLAVSVFFVQNKIFAIIIARPIDLKLSLGAIILIVALWQGDNACVIGEKDCSDLTNCCTCVCVEGWFNDDAIWMKEV